jgi:hypothetical protein
LVGRLYELLLRLARIGSEVKSALVEAESRMMQ